MWIRKSSQPLLTQKSQRKQRRWRLGNRQWNNFLRLAVDSEELAVPVDSEKVNENTVDADWEILIETPSKGDAWIWKRSQPLLTLKKSTKQLPKVTRGFGRARSPYWLRKSHWNTFQRWHVDLEAPQPLLTMKRWTKNLPKAMRGFGSACSPFWLRKGQRNQSRCRLWNHQRNTFHRWRLDSWEHTAPFDSEIVNKN